MKESEQLLVTPPYQGARKYGKTSFERGYEQGVLKGELKGVLKGMQKILRTQLVKRFGPLSEEVIKRLESYSEPQLLELGKQLLTASSLQELGLEH